MDFYAGPGCWAAHNEHHVGAYGGPELSNDHHLVVSQIQWQIVGCQVDLVDPNEK